jgi:hypothetical protein
MQGYHDTSNDSPNKTAATSGSCMETVGAEKGRCVGGFPSRREYLNELYCVPCPEILEAMGLGPEEVVKVKRGCYG